MELHDASRIVWNILKGMPIEVFDEDSGSVWENDTWELCKARSEGDFKGSRMIGSANIVTALNMINQKLVISHVADEKIQNTSDISYELFAEVMDSLQKRNLIRKKPEKVRQQFRVIDNAN